MGRPPENWFIADDAPAIIDAGLWAAAPRSAAGPASSTSAGPNAHGTAVCVRVEAKQDWAVRQVIAELRDGPLLPQRLE